MRTGHGPPVCTARRLPELRLPTAVPCPPWSLCSPPLSAACRAAPAGPCPVWLSSSYLSSSGTAASSSGSISSCSVWNARGADTTADVIAALTCMADSIDMRQ